MARLNPYKQTELWHRIMMATLYRCSYDGCNQRHAVHVDNMRAVCVYHATDATHPPKTSNW